MNINSFIDKYGKYSFNDLSFNEIDNVIFSALIYIDFSDIFNACKKKFITIGELSEFVIQNYYKYKNNVYVVRKSLKLLKNLRDVNRYKDLHLYNYKYEIGNEEQFGAITIEINKKLVYDSFEGTDHLISGWKENFMFSYMFPTISQKCAIDYVNRNFWFRNKKIILGGHSKGGNLAMVAGMYANFWVKNKIVKIYNNDGPGLLLEQINSKKYELIKDKLIHIVPDYSIVGMLLYNGDNYRVVKSMRKSIYSHDFMTWVTKDKEFLGSELSLFSETFNKRILDWINKYSYEDREKFVVSLFSVFKKANIESLLDIKKNKLLLFDLLKKFKTTDEVTKGMMKEFIFIILDVYKNVSIEDFKSNLKLKK